MRFFRSRFFRVGSRRQVAAVLVAALMVPGILTIPAAAEMTQRHISAQNLLQPNSAQGPAEDEFYRPPSPLPPGVNGDVIWSRELPQDGVLQQSAIKNYLVLYRSTSATGHPIAVTGRILVPAGAWVGGGERPLVSLASGTRGVGDDCAPSKFFPDYERPLIEPMLRRGWAVAITDYEGLGTPGGHTYVVGRSEGHAVIDAARAATRLPATGLRAGGPVAFSGYSQGGGGAAWAGELAPNYAPELNVVGVVAGGTPANLLEVAKFLDGGVGFGFQLMAAYGFDAAYPELNLQAFLNKRGKETYQREQEACVDSVLLHPFQRIEQFTTTNPLDTPQWQARLNENKLGSAPQSTPIYLFHGTNDEIIPLAQAEKLRDDYCRAGSKVTWQVIPGEHVSTLVTGLPGAMTFLAERFEGKPAGSTC